MNNDVQITVSTVADNQVIALGEIEGFMRGAGYEQQAPGSLGPEQQCRWIAAGRKALGEQSAELPSDPVSAPQPP